MGDGISADKKICSKVWQTYQDVPKHLLNLPIKYYI